MTKPIIYLACPYSSDDENVRNDRFARATAVATRLIEKGYNIYSPITHGHFMSGKNTTWEYWGDHCEALVEASKLVLVLKLEGYQQSTGVNGEIEHAIKLGIPIEYIDYDDIEQFSDNSKNQYYLKNMVSTIQCTPDNIDSFAKRHCEVLHELEQVRARHIEGMELIENYRDNNQELKEEIAELKRKLIKLQTESAKRRDWLKD